MEDGMLDRGRISTGESVEVERDDRDLVGESFYHISALRYPNCQKR